MITSFKIRPTAMCVSIISLSLLSLGLIGKRNKEATSDKEDPVARIEAVCKRYVRDPFRVESGSLRNHVADLNKFSFFSPLGSRGELFALCSVQKVASNSWGKFITEALLREAAALNRSNEDFELRTLVNADCWPNCGRNMTKIIPVRHPFKRVLSAWRHIFDRDKRKYGLTETIPWPDFVDLVSGLKEATPKWSRIQRDIGSHWEPFWRACSVCHEHLGPPKIWVVKMENLPHDLEQLLLLLRLPVEEAVNFPHLVPGPKFEAKTDFYKHFYSQLSSEQLEALKEAYKMDLELFGYDGATVF